METTFFQKMSYLTLRLMGSLIFITAGVNHLFWQNEAVARLEKAAFGHLALRMATPETLIFLSGSGLLLGGILLLVGYKTKPAALVLLSILIPITITVQLANPAGSGPLFKNIAIMGMLLFFMANGAPYYSLDQLLSAKWKGQRRALMTAGKSVGMLVIALMALSSCVTQKATAQAGERLNTSADPKNYAVLISQPNHLAAAVHTAETIKPGSPYYRDHFIVMACGKSVEAFVEGSSMQEQIRKGKASGITYKVCGLSLKQFNIDSSTLVKDVEVVPNGLTYMFELQRQGYNTVEL